MSDRLVVGAILTDDLRQPRQVLAARRTRPPELAGYWEFPGGKVEAAESPQDALRRELREELGLGRIELGEELVGPDPAGWPIGPTARLRLYFATSPDEPRQLDGSHDQLRWLAVAELTDVAWLESDAEALRELGRVLDSSRTDDQLHR